MSEKQPKLIQVRLEGKEIDIFNSAFEKSGLRSESEFIRYLATQFNRETEKS